MGPRNMIIDEEIEEKYNDDQVEKTYDVDIWGIIQDKMNDLEDLKMSLLHLSSALDILTGKIMNFESDLDTIELDALTGRPLLHSSIYIFLKFQFSEKLNISMDKFCAFIDKMERSYHAQNPYHNKMHATEVMMASMLYIECLEHGVKSMISTQQIFAAFISAIVHDVDHPGNNNAFEINTESVKSILYSDQSV